MTRLEVNITIQWGDLPLTCAHVSAVDALRLHERFSGWFISKPKNFEQQNKT
jgi:hypothetical protein